MEIARRVFADNLRRFLSIGFIALLANCERSERLSQEKSPPDSARVAVSSTQQTPVPSATITGPRLLVDSLLSEPVLERGNEMYVLRVPVLMAKVLYDSLPGFSPFERSAYKKDLVEWVDKSASEGRSEVGASDPALALSVVVGDFNGDSRRDVAMRGASRDSSATVFLLAPSNGRSPSLIFIGRPQQLFPSEQEWVYLKPVHPGTHKGFEEAEGAAPLKLRTEAVEVVAFEKASTIVFLENGTLQRFSTSD